VETERILSHLDPIARALYFSNDLTNIMVGLDDTEAYRSFPFTDKSSFTTWEGACVRGYNKPRYSGAPSRVGYTPLCRPWYENARTNGGNITINSIDVSASTGQLFLALSAGLYDADSNLFGVAGIEASVVSIQQLLQTIVLANGYFYLADRDQRLAVHPRLGSGVRETVVNLEFSGCTDVDVDVNRVEVEQEWMLIKYPDIVVAKSGSAEYTKCGEKHLLLWHHVGDVYIVFLTLPLADITQKADDSQAAIEVVILVSVCICVGCCGLLSLVFLIFIATTSSKAVGGLSGAINQIAHHENYDVTLPAKSAFHSKELATILENVHRMLVALRFGNEQWHHGSVEMQFSNFAEVEKVMQEVANQKGVGVVLNNKGNLWLNNMNNPELAKRWEWMFHDAANSKCPQLASAHACFEIAIDIVRGVPGEEERLGTRLCSLGLTSLEQASFQQAASDPGAASMWREKASNSFTEATAVLEQIGAWRVLAWLAYALALHPMSTGTAARAELQSVVLHARDEALRAALGLLRSVSSPLEPPDFTPLAQLTLACYAKDADPQLVRWTLAKVPQLDKSMCIHLAAHAKSAASTPQSLVDAIDQSMSPFDVKHWVVGRVPSGTIICRSKVPRCMVILLDVSWSMLFGNEDLQPAGKAPGKGGKWLRTDGIEFLGEQVDGLEHLFEGENTRLSISSESIRRLCGQHLRADDMVGFATFSGETVWDLQLTKVQDAARSPVNSAVDKVQPRKTGTAFFTAVADAVAVIERLPPPRMEQWIIALTDGADNKSAKGAVQTVCSRLKATCTNIAVITVGNLPSDTIVPIRSMCDSAKAAVGDAPVQGLHFVAESADKISEAFQQVADAIGGMQEAR